MTKDMLRYVLDGVKTLDLIYHFIYLLDDESNYKINRKNHLINKWIILSILDEEIM